MKITCPRCGEPGYLTKVKVYGKHYMRVEHVEGGKRRVCYLGRDAGALRQHIESVLGSSSAEKIIRYAGGDYKIAGILRPRLERLCPQPRCTFVEVFGGSGYMAQTVPRAVFGNIIYNDINDRLTALYKHIKENPEQLATILSFLPYSRSYHRIVTKLMLADREFGSLVAAALAFYAYNSSIHGTSRGGFSYSVDPDHNEAKKFSSRISAVLKYAAAWKDITIENLDFREVIKRYDAEKTVFYLDPPYVDRGKDYYGTPFTVDDLRHMASMLAQIRGRFLLKVDKKTYSKISDILPPGRYAVEEFERKKNMVVVKGAQRDTWTMVLVSTPAQNAAD